jgi:hypothetical protein
MVSVGVASEEVMGGAVCAAAIAGAAVATTPAAPSEERKERRLTWAAKIFLLFILWVSNLPSTFMITFSRTLCIDRGEVSECIFPLVGGYPSHVA